MRILFDINVVLDVLLNRQDSVGESARLMGLVERGVIEGYLCATTLTTLDYLMTKASNKEQARTGVRGLLTLFRIAEVNATVLEMAMDSAFDDFEDAVQYHAGIACNVDGLVTRNPRDYPSYGHTPSLANGCRCYIHPCTPRFQVQSSTESKA